MATLSLSASGEVLRIHLDARTGTSACRRDVIEILQMAGVITFSAQSFVHLDLFLISVPDSLSLARIVCFIVSLSCCH